MSRSYIMITLLLMTSLGCKNDISNKASIASNLPKSSESPKQQKSNKGISSAANTSSNSSESTTTKELDLEVTESPSGVEPKSSGQVYQNDKKSNTPSQDETESSSKVKSEIKENQSRLKVSKNTDQRAQPRKVTPKYKPVIEFDQLVYEYDTITEGNIVKYDFKFVNKGEGNLEVKKTDVSCGCTVPSYPFLPIEPGNGGKIGAVFNSVGKHGDEESFIEVYSNATKDPIKLTLKGYVKERKTKKSK